VLVYSTCTLTDEENEEIRKWMLEDMRFEAESLDPFLPDRLKDSQTAQGQIRILPGRFGTDGFYIARFRRVG
jgi:16S rRNA (cytosine967-C5)-methyltransferase